MVDTIKRILFSSLTRYTLFLGVVYFVCRALLSQLGSINLNALSVSWRFLALSFLFEISARCFTGWGYDRLLTYFDSAIGYFPSASIAWISYLGKYLPGKFFLVVVAMYYFRQYKIRWEIAGIIPVLNTLMTVGAALILSFPVVYIVHDKFGNASLFGLVFLIILCLGFCFKPQLLFSWARILLLRFGISGASFTLSRSQAIHCLGIALLQCVCLGMSTWSIARAFMPIGIETSIWFISITPFSIIVGLLAFFSPAGIGVREGICFFAFSGIVGPEMASLITVVSRAVFTLADLLSAGVGFAFLRYIAIDRR